MLPLLYLHGLSSGDFAPALGQFLGSAAGLSAATITPMTTQRHDDANAFNERSLAETDYVYCWVDGIHLKVRLDQDKVCLLVMIGVRGDGTKELIALADGFRESAQSWADLVREGERRGRASGAGWPRQSSRSVTAHWDSARPSARCSPTPAGSAAGAKAALAEIDNAEDKDHALKAAKAFADLYGAKWPKAVAKVTEHLDVPLAFYDYPAEHWVHLRTTNPNRPSQPSGCDSGSPRARAREPPGWRWRSSSSSPLNAVGAP